MHVIKHICYAYVDATVKALGVGGAKRHLQHYFHRVELQTFINFKCPMLIGKSVYSCHDEAFISHYFLTLVFNISLSNAKLFLGLSHIVCFSLTSRILLKLCLQCRMHFTYLCLFHFIYHLRFGLNILSDFFCPSSVHLRHHPVLYSVSLLEFSGNIQRAKMVFPAPCHMSVLDEPNVDLRIAVPILVNAKKQQLVVIEVLTLCTITVQNRV